MRIGLSMPVVMRLPDAASPWERDGDTEAIARAVENSDRYCDQLAALSTLADHTEG